ncbi:MAG: ATP-binding protein, partial [Campylobacterota bacterium]
TFQYMCIVFWVTTYFIMKKGNPLALIFLLGHSVFAIFLTITNLYYMGVFDHGYFVHNAALMGMIIEAVTLALIISYRIKLLQKSEMQYAKELAKQDEIKKMNEVLQFKIDEEVKKSREKDQMMFQQNKMASMGEMMGNIAHQWRQPLSVIDMTTLGIQTKLDLEKFNLDDKTSQKNFVKFLKKELEDIHQYTHYLTKTIDDFKNYFKPNKEKELTTLDIPIKKALMILKSSIVKERIEIQKEIQTNHSIEIYTYELMQVFVNIIKNSIDNFKEKGTLDPKIMISVVEEQDAFLIKICDNGGGIDETILPQIFDPYFSTKDDKHGTGIGLYMSKVLIEHYSTGSLTAKNSEEGICFEIYLYTSRHDET